MTRTFEELSQVPTGDRDPVRIIEEQNLARLQDLVPVRIGRMLQSPFAYYRGTAANMAADLAELPTTGVNVFSCGDAHISNFGFYASPGRSLVFDLNDFDETGLAPWDWDVRRLMASVYLAALDVEATSDEAQVAVREAAKAYRRWTHKLNQVSALERYYATLDVDRLEAQLKGKSRQRMDRVTDKAKRRTSAQALEKLVTQDTNGQLRIVDQPPLTRHTDYAAPERLQDIWQSYLSSTRADIHYLLSDFKLVDVVLRVVGVGSVGTRCFILLLTDRHGEPLFLQVKEARASVLETYGGIAQDQSVLGRMGHDAHGDGFRVVAGQRILQAQSDPFLGWVRGYAGESGREVPVDYYWRQFRDMKGTIDLSKLGLPELTQTAQVCAGMLARAHAQSPGAAEVAEYLAPKGFPKAMAAWAKNYAEVCLRDFHALREAADSGRVPVEYGL